MNENDNICTCLDIDKFDVKFNYIPYNYINNDIKIFMI